LNHVCHTQTAWRVFLARDYIILLKGLGNEIEFEYFIESGPGPSGTGNGN
jgi:hypothetical protein